MANNLQRLASQEYWEKIPDSITSLATQQGIIISRKTTRAVTALGQAHFSIIELEKQLLLAIRPFKNGTLPLNCRKVIIVVSIKLTMRASTHQYNNKFNRSGSLLLPPLRLRTL